MHGINGGGFILRSCVSFNAEALHHRLFCDEQIA
jgi:hypothetical protein